MIDLFDRSTSFNGDTFRNIVSLRKSEDLFDDLTHGDPTLGKIAQEIETRVKMNSGSPGLIERAFHYSTAIGYPFDTQPFMVTRFSDGRFPAWYGSLEMDTTVHETVHHMRKFERAKQRKIVQTEPIYRERAVYKVDLTAVLLDLRGKEKKEKRLVLDDYSYTNQLGKQLADQGHPGLLTRSARCNGTNAAIFQKRVLSNPRVHCYLTYVMDMSDFSVRVERMPGEVYLMLGGA